MIMTIPEAAEATGLSKYALRKGIKHGIYPAFQIQEGLGRFFMEYDELNAAIKANQEKQRLARMPEATDSAEKGQPERNVIVDTRLDNLRG